MEIQEFAENHKLKTRLDDCGEKVIPGRLGQIYEYSDAEMGVMFMPPSTAKEPWGRWSPKIWGNFRRAGIAAGMTLRQNADSEGCLSFDPKDKAQTKLAIKIAKVKAKRVMSEKQAAHLSTIGFQHTQERPLAS